MLKIIANIMIIILLLIIITIIILISIIIIIIMQFSPVLFFFPGSSQPCLSNFPQLRDTTADRISGVSVIARCPQGKS